MQREISEGDLMSLILFSVCIAPLINDIQELEGLPMFGVKLVVQSYQDDVLCFVKSPEALQVI